MVLWSYRGWFTGCCLPGLLGSGHSWGAPCHLRGLCWLQYKCRMGLIVRQEPGPRQERVSPEGRASGASSASQLLCMAEEALEERPGRKHRKQLKNGRMRKSERKWKEGDTGLRMLGALPHNLGKTLLSCCLSLSCPGPFAQNNHTHTCPSTKSTHTGYLLLPGGGGTAEPQDTGGIRTKTRSLLNCPDLGQPEIYSAFLLTFPHREKGEILELGFPLDLQSGESTRTSLQHTSRSEPRGLEWGRVRDKS